MSLRILLAVLCSAGFGAAGCTPEAPSQTGPDSSGAAASASAPLRGPPAVAEAQLPDFAGLIERLVNGAAERVLTGGSSDETPDDARLLPVSARRVPDDEPLDREFDVTAAGQAGTVHAYGLAFTRPWPARYDMALALEGFSVEPALTVQGAVQYNFIRDDRATPAANHGLFRARLTLDGTFEGDVDLHGEIVGGKIVSLVVLTGRESMIFGGREPRPLVSYVTTLAGTGEAGNADGPAADATFNRPSGVIVERTGRVLIADTSNNAVRVLSPNGEVSTLSTAFEAPSDLGLDGLGLLVVSDRASRTNAGLGPISRVVTRGVLAGTVIRTVGAVGKTLNGLPLCTNFYCDGRSPLAQIQYAFGIDVEGAIVTVADWALPDGLRVVTPDGAVMTMRSWAEGGCTGPSYGSPYDVALGTRGEIYFTTDCHAVWKLASDGTITALAGRPDPEIQFADGVGQDARFGYPAGLVTDGEYLYLTESVNELLRRVDPRTGATVRIAGCLSHRDGFDCTSQSGFRDGPGDYAQFDGPRNLALDPWGDLYVADERNHAIRFVRLANDPERRPVIENVRPLVLQQGAEAVLTIRGRDLGIAREVDLGEGITATILERSAKKLKVHVAVEESAPSGERRLAVATPFGRAALPDGMRLSVLDERASQVRVTTLSGTGAWAPSVNGILPAEHATYAFPGGIAAIDKDRVLIADPLENRVRLITTKDGAARELLELAAYQAGGTVGTQVLEGLGQLEGIAGDVLGAFGADSSAAGPREALLGAIGDALDAICESYGSDCDHMVLPWAGVAGPGDSGGFRLNARLFLPSDVATFGADKFLIADTGNYRIKTVGLDFSGPDEPQDAPYQVGNTDTLRTYPLAVAGTANDTVVAATTTDATLAKVTLRDGSSVLTSFAGVRDEFRCTRADGDVRHPLGVPIGIATGRIGTFIADPFCQTIWKLDANGEVEDIRGALKVDLSTLPPCTDGPLMFATFSRPMDLAVDSAGNIWVVDSGCNSVRVIKDVYQSSGAADAAERLGGWAERVGGWLGSETLATASERLRDPNLGELDAARWWVVTVAGSVDGEAGFRDGPASDALFNAPVSIALAEDDAETYVFVSDVGNKRIRMIDMQSRGERTTRVPPPAGGVTQGGPGDAPLSPIDAVNYLLSLPWQGLVAQAEADADKAVNDLLEDFYLVRGTGAENGVEWSFSLRVNDADADLELSPPGFVAASPNGVEIAAPLQGTWSASFDADVDGNATVKVGGVPVFTWTPTIFGFGLGVKELKITAKADLDPNAPGPPALEQVATQVSAHVYGTGALAFDLPLSLRPGLRDGAFVLTRNLTDQRVDLGDGLVGALTGEVELALLPVQPPADDDIEPAESTRRQIATLVPLPEDEPVPDSKPVLLARITLRGQLAVELPQVGGVAAPFAVAYSAEIPSSDDLNVMLGALREPIPRVWGGGPPSAPLALSTAAIRSGAEYAEEAARIDAALRQFHAPDGVVLSLVHPDFNLNADPDPLTWGGAEDAALFTGAYLAAQSYRYAAAPSAEALAGVDFALSGLEALFDATTGVAVAGDVRVPVRADGILPRVLIRYGTEPEEIDFAEKLQDRPCYYEKPAGGWRLALGDYTRVHSSFAEAAAVVPALVGAAPEARRETEPVGPVTYAWGCGDDEPVTRDQYSGVMMGLAVANRLVDDPGVRARTARLIERALDYLIASAWNVPLPPDDRIALASSFLGSYDKQLAMLLLGKTVNRRKYGPLYDYVAQASSLTWVQHWFSTVDPSDQYFKFNLAHSVLAIAMQLEDDPALRANYRLSADVLWEATGHHRNAYFDLLHVLFQEPPARAAALDGASAFGQPGITLRAEIQTVLGEWLDRRNAIASLTHPELPMNRVPDVPFLLSLWPDDVGRYVTQAGKDRVYTRQALPVSKRLGRNMEFIWERQPFEPGFDHKLALTEQPSERDVRYAGERNEHRRTEGPGVDYLIAYWLAAYLDALPAE